MQAKIMHAYLYECCNLFRVPFSRLVWATRHETGEKFGREHYHWLIGGVDFKPSISEMFQLNSLWDSFPKAGFARHYRYDNSQHGIAYITKALSSESGFREAIGAQVYEVRKFGFESSEVNLSNALIRLVGGRRMKPVENIRRARKSGFGASRGGLISQYSEDSRRWAERL